MQAGILKERIQVQRPTVRTDEYGANVIEYNNIINTRAAVINKSGNRANENGEIVYNYIKSFTVRYYHNIQENDIIIWNNKKYRITDIDEVRDKQYKIINSELIND